MLTIQTLERIKLGARITLFSGIFAGLYGILHLIFINFLLKMNFETVEVVWRVFSKYNSEMAGVIFRLVLLKCIFIITTAIAIIYLSSYILRRKDKVAWVILFVIGIIFWPALLTMEILDKNLYTIMASGLGWIIFIIGMLIPIRYYLEREYTEY